jgi:acyl-CoA thioesterase-1
MNGSEPLPLLARWLIFHIASGQAFFSGTCLLIAALGLTPFGRSRAVRISRNGLILLGLSLVGLSSTPLASWCGLLVLATSGAWAISRLWRRPLSRPLELSLVGAATAGWLLAIAVEIPHHLPPSLPPLGRPTLGIIGDSLTEGMGTSDIVTWPRLLADAHSIPVRDHARMGATVASALEQAEQVGPDEDLVLLEIGGNDLLGTTPSDAFHADLDQLLSSLRRPGRTLVMLELPLPPGSSAFGRAQRQLARDYDVILVPKRFLIGLLQAPGVTLDTIHLSQQGHRRMADGIWKILAGAYRQPGQH